MNLLEQAIAKIEASIDAYNEVDTFVMEENINSITNAGYKLEAVEPLLQLIERHPTAYFGDPGAIVHFIEQFGTEYEKYLVESLKRTPGSTTVWMLNRCINAGGHREALIGLMKEITNRTDVEEEVRGQAQAQAQEFVDFQEKR